MIETGLVVGYLVWFLSYSELIGIPRRWLEERVWVVRKWTSCGFCFGFVIAAVLEVARRGDFDAMRVLGAAFVAGVSMLFVKACVAMWAMYEQDYEDAD